MQVASGDDPPIRTRTDVPRVRFPARRPFHADLKRRVEEYFEGGARSRHGGWAMAFKSAAMLAWLAASYALVMFTHVRGWEAALLSVSVGLAMAGVGFSVMHDANHGSTSSSARTNGILSFTLDLIGGSSFLWRRKHNVLHHTYTNISSLDPDLEGGGPLLRLAPWQPRHGHHRFQHLYVWLLYGFFPLKWWFVDDFRELATCTTRRSPGSSRRLAARTGCATAASPRCAARSQPTGAGCAAWDLPCRPDAALRRRSDFLRTVDLERKTLAHDSHDQVLDLCL